MDINVRDLELRKLCVIDTAKSVIWNAMYDDVGEFEITLSAMNLHVEHLQVDHYVTRDDDDCVGIITSVHVQSDIEDGDFYIVKGEFLGALLRRRIVWTQTTYTNMTAENVIRSFINSNAINPTDSRRRIPRLVLGSVAGFTDVIPSIQRTGTSLLKVVCDICHVFGYGFKIVLNDRNQFEFVLYRGVNRSYEQTRNPYVVFSEEYDNLSSNEYLVSLEEYSNVALVGGEGEGSARRYMSVNNAAHGGMDRYELFVDARDVSSNEGAIPAAEYNNQLVSRGVNALQNITEIFDGDIEITPQYVYKKDFFIGDIVTVKSLAWGIEISRRIYGMIESEDESGSVLSPVMLDRGVVELEMEVKDSYG